MKKILKVICTVMCIALLFVGCSNGTGESSGKSLIKSKYDFEGTPYTLFTQQERRIWYYSVYYNEPLELRYDSTPDVVLIVENGDVSAYDRVEKTYGELVDMTDDEIVDYLKNDCYCEVDWYSELSELYNMYNIGDEIKCGDTIYDGYTAEYDGKIVNKEELPKNKNSHVAFYLECESTGNETNCEQLIIDDNHYRYGYSEQEYGGYIGEYIESRGVHYNIISWSTEPQIIYSTKFATLYCADSTSSSDIEGTLVTRVDGEYKLEFDSPDTDFGNYQGEKQ